MTNRPYNTFTKVLYQGTNVEKLLQASDCLEWATFLQWKEKGYKIRKGEHGTVIHRFLEETKKDVKTGTLKEVTGVRSYTVFNATQVEKI